MASESSCSAGEAWRSAGPAVYLTVSVQLMYSKAAKRAFPAWACPYAVFEAYCLAQLRTEMTGVKFEVDHIVPLKAKDACGLHTEFNLQVIPAALNAEKNNRNHRQYRWSDFFRAC